LISEHTQSLQAHIKAESEAMLPTIQRTQNIILAGIGVLATGGLLASIGVLASFALDAGGFRRVTCLERVRTKIASADSTLEAKWFWGPNGMDERFPILSLPGCYQLCNGDSRWYIDAGPRFMTWLLPAVLLIGNMDVSPLDKWRYLEVFHLLGDPINSMWSLLARVGVWSSCFFLAKKKLEQFPGLDERQLGTILAAIDETIGSEENPLDCLTEIVFPGNTKQEQACTERSNSSNKILQSSHQSYEMSDLPGQCIRIVVNERRDQDAANEVYEDGKAPEGGHLISAAVRVSSPETVKILKDAAFDIADSRTDDIIRTTFAVCLFLLQLLSAFITVLGGGNNSPPGGRIAIVMLLTWLIPAIMLSNSVGGFASRRTCFRIIRKVVCKIRTEQHRQQLLCRVRELQKQIPLQERLQERKDLRKELQDLMQHLLENNDQEAQNVLTEQTPLETTLRNSEAFFRNQRWSGGSDLYRPNKYHQFGPCSKQSTRTMLALSIGPVLISLVFGSAILWKTPPYGFNCRSLMLLIITLSWSLSAFLTQATWELLGRQLGRRGHWHLVVWKDAAVAIPTVLFLFLSSAGLFNTCYCRSFAISKGWIGARVPLNVTSEFDQLNGKLYPILAASCLFFQFAFFLAMRRVGRQGFRLMRWPDKERQLEFLEDPPWPLRYRIWRFLKKVRHIFLDLVVK
jgi:hypothetical protein